MLRMKGTADMEAKIGGRKFVAFLSMAHSILYPHCLRVRIV
jgi:hypothetical protein